MDNLENIIDKIKNNSEEENKKLAQKLTEQLSDSQNDALSRLLSDKKLISQIMNSPKAQEILKNISGEKNGHK